MRFRISYEVSRGNALENEDYVADEVLFLRHQSIDTGDRDHDRDNDRGWMIVPSVEQVVWLQRHYAKTERYMHLTTVAAVIEPDDLACDTLSVSALLRRVKFVWEALDLESRGKVFLRYADDDAELANDIAALLAYTTQIEPHLLPSSRGNDWNAADKPYRESLVARGTADEFSKLVVAPADLPTDAAGLRQLIESIRSDPRRRVTLRYDDDYDVAQAVAGWLADATGASVSPEPI